MSCICTAHRAGTRDTPSHLRRRRLQYSITVLQATLPRARLACICRIARYLHTATSSVQRPISAALHVLPLTSLQQSGSHTFTAFSSVSPTWSACCCTTMAAPKAAGPHLTDAACAACHMVQVHRLDGVNNDGLWSQTHLQRVLHPLNY